MRDIEWVLVRQIRNIVEESADRVGIPLPGKAKELVALLDR